MSDKILLGIDCGDADLRAAYFYDGTVAKVPLPSESSTPTIFFDPYANISSIGVGFPSIIGSVGTSRRFNYEQREETPDSIVTRRLTAIRETVLGHSKKMPDLTVLAVPATFSEHRRRAMLDCAGAAGFQAVQLVDKCTAAAIGFQGGARESKTILVFHMGYSDCEYSVARLGRGRCRVVASGASPEVSGEMLDALMLETIVLALRKDNIFLGLKDLSSKQWLEFRRIAETSRGRFENSPTFELSLDPQITRLDKQINVEIAADNYAEKFNPLFEKATDGLYSILEQGQLELQDIDQFLVVGKSGTKSYVLRQLTQGFNGQPRAADLDLVAVGAAYYAQHRSDAVNTADSSPNGAADGSTDEVSSDQSQPVDSGPDTGDEQSGSQPRQSEPPPASDMSLDTARRLVADGRHTEAEAMIEQIQQEAKSLKQQLQRMQPAPEPEPTTNVWLARADILLDEGRYQEAVGLSHRAYEEAHDDPATFAGMMRVHVEAALKMKRPEEYQAAIKLLACAHGHDQTDRSVHKAMADRHFMHAVAMLNLNNISLANQAVSAALSYNPKHEGACKMLEELATQTAEGESEDN